MYPSAASPRWISSGLAGKWPRAGSSSARDRRAGTLVNPRRRQGEPTWRSRQWIEQPHCNWNGACKSPRRLGRQYSWGAILGGAVAAAALSLILLALGSGLGLSSICPWTCEDGGSRPRPSAWGPMLAARHGRAGGPRYTGGYLAGRLHVKWSDVDADEAFFRDTAHGFLAWGVVTIVSAAILTSAASSMVGAVAKTGAAQPRPQSQALLPARPPPSRTRPMQCATTLSTCCSAPTGR